MNVLTGRQICALILSHLFLCISKTNAATICPPPSAAREIVDCIAQTHPEVRAGELGLEQSKAGVGSAGMVPNPQLQVQYAVGKQLGDELLQSQIVLVQPIEWGGKRSSRIAFAEAGRSITSANLTAQKIDARTLAILNLYRLNQLDTERATLDEAIQTYQKLVSQYRKRPRLTPEQETSLGIFELAESDYRIRFLSLEEEERTLATFFAVAGGYSLDQIRKVYPDQPKNWPQVSGPESSVNGSPELLRIVSERQRADSELQSARALAWPTFGVGPLVQFQSEGPIRGTLFGFQLNLDLPVFNLNGPGRAAARKGFERSEVQLESFRRTESLERQAWLKTYEDSKRLLVSMTSSKTLDKKHEKTEALFLRGIVPTVLIVEAHRQRVDFEKSRHDRILRTLESLWRIYRIDGVALEQEPIIP